MEERINQYIDYIIKNPLADIYQTFEKFFSNIKKNTIESVIIYPELLKLIPSKRALIYNLVLTKLNYNIVSSRDSLKPFIRIKEKGQTGTRNNIPDKKTQWLYK